MAFIVNWKPDASFDSESYALCQLILLCNFFINMVWLPSLLAFSLAAWTMDMMKSASVITISDEIQAAEICFKFRKFDVLLYKKYNVCVCVYIHTHIVLLFIVSLQNTVLKVFHCQLPLPKTLMCDQPWAVNTHGRARMVVQRPN